MKRGIGTIAVVVSAHWICAISMVFVNKRLVGEQDASQDISVFIVWVQNMVGCVIFALMRIMINYLSLNIESPATEVDSLLDPDMVLSSVTFTGTLVFNNLMLKYISVAFYQVARSLTLIFVIGFSTVILHDSINRRIALACVFIILGFYTAVDEEIVSQGVQTAGIVYGVLASLCAALCGVFFKRFQRKRGTTSMQLTLNNCIISSIILSPLLFSSGQLRNFLYSPAMYSLTTWFLLVISGAISMSMGWISALQIELTSPLTHNISINAKSLVQTLMAVIISGDPRPWRWWLGNGFVMMGIATYTAHKLTSQQSAHRMSIDVKAKESEVKVGDGYPLLPRVGSRFSS